MDIIEYLGFWDWAIIIYLVGLVLAFILIHDRLSKQSGMQYRLR